MASELPEIGTSSQSIYIFRSKLKPFMLQQEERDISDIPDKGGVKMFLTKKNLALGVAIATLGLGGCATYKEEFATINSRLDSLDQKVQSAAQSAESANQSAQQANQRLDQLEGRVQQLETAPRRVPRG